MNLNRYLKSNRKRFSIYFRLISLILLIYFVNLIFGFRSFRWMEKSFESEYYLTMKQIDALKIDLNAEKYYGQAINLISSQFLISNKFLCGQTIDPERKLFPHLLILVKSFVQHRKQRQAIRLTWANKYFLQPKNIQLAFVVGKDMDNQSIENESNKYQDLIQIDQIDYYYYSSHKMLMMLRWIDEYCSSKSIRSSDQNLRHYVLFIDDDFFLNHNKLDEFLSKIDHDPEMTTFERRTFTTGYRIDNARPKRFFNDPFYISYVDYPYDRYPTYLSSQCLLMTIYSSHLFYLSSHYTRIFPFDDVYLGLLAYSMSIPLIDNNNQFISSESTIKRKEFQWNSSICLHGYRNEQLIQLWNQIYRTDISLSTNE